MQQDLASLRRGAVAADGLILIAIFIHPRSSELQPPKKRRRAIGDALASSERPLIVTSGTLLLQRPGPLATEQDASGGTPASPALAQAHHLRPPSCSPATGIIGYSVVMAQAPYLLRRYLLAARRSLAPMFAGSLLAKMNSGGVASCRALRVFGAMTLVREIGIAIHVWH